MQRRAEDRPTYPATFVVQQLQCGGESCFNRLDLEIIKSPARRPENSHIVVFRRPNIWIRRTEEQNAICAGGRSQMRNSTVVPDEYRALQDSGEARQRQVAGETDITILPFAFQLVGLSFVCLASDHPPAFQIRETAIWRK